MTAETRNMIAGTTRPIAARQPTVGAGFARALFDLGIAKGVSSAVLESASGVDRAELEDRDGRIAFAKYVALMRAAKALSGDAALALHFGETFDISEVSVIGLIGAPSMTMAEAFARTNRYASLAVEVETSCSGRFELEEHDDELWIVDTRVNPNDFPELTESTFARMACSMRRFAADRPLLRRVHVSHADPGYAAEYERIFGVPVFFSSEKNALVTSAGWLDDALPPSSSYVASVMTTHADALLTELQESRSFRGRVETVLIPLLETRDFGMSSIARRLGVSRQTLFRRLQAEGVTFEKILDELRQKLARHCLDAKKLSVGETAYLLGFSDPAAFSRAFKRWTGASPRSARTAKP